MYTYRLQLARGSLCLPWCCWRRLDIWKSKSCELMVLIDEQAVLISSIAVLYLSAGLRGIFLLEAWNDMVGVRGAVGCGPIWGLYARVCLIKIEKWAYLYSVVIASFVFTYDIIIMLISNICVHKYPVWFFLIICMTKKNMIFLCFGAKREK